MSTDLARFTGISAGFWAMHHKIFFPGDLKFTGNIFASCCIVAKAGSHLSEEKFLRLILQYCLTPRDVKEGSIVGKVTANSFLVGRGGSGTGITLNASE